MTDFRIGIDWRRKGYICRDARPGDPLNVLPTPITYAALNCNTFQGSTVTRQAHHSPYGTTRCDIQTGTGNWAGLIIGRDPAGQVNRIPVRVGQMYTLRVWIRGVANYAGVPFDVQVLNDDMNWLSVVSSATLTDTFTPYTLTFTPQG